MPAGHVNKKTVNLRPLTTNMKLVLADLMREGAMHQSRASQSDKNVLRALIDRGYADWSIETACYTSTEAGEDALMESRA